MKNIELITAQDFARVIDEVIDVHIHYFILQHDIQATGDFKTSLTSKEVSNNEVDLFGIDYSKYAVTGRGAGKAPPINDLIKWVNAKFGYAGPEAKSMAFAIQKKIAKEGTERKKKNLDLFELLSSPEITNYIIQQLSIIAQRNAKAYLIEQLKNLNK